MGRFPSGRWKFELFDALKLAALVLNMQKSGSRCAIRNICLARGGSRFQVAR